MANSDYLGAVCTVDPFWISHEKGDEDTNPSENQEDDLETDSIGNGERAEQREEMTTYIGLVGDDVCLGGEGCEA